MPQRWANRAEFKRVYLGARPPCGAQRGMCPHSLCRSNACACQPATLTGPNCHYHTHRTPVPAPTPIHLAWRACAWPSSTAAQAADSEQHTRAAQRAESRNTGLPASAEP